MHPSPISSHPTRRSYPRETRPDGTVSGGADRGWVSGIPTNDPADCYFPASSTQPDRFIPNRSALDLDIAHYNLVKENANANDLDLAAEVASPSKVRRLLRQRPIRDDSRSSIESNKNILYPSIAQLLSR